MPIKVKCNFLKILEERKELHQENVAKKRNEEIISNDDKNSAGEIDPIFLTLSEALFIHPTGPINLQSNKKLNLVLKFQPQKRIKQFSEKIALQIDSTILPLSIIVKGSCAASEFTLNRNYISFGSVVLGSTVNSKLLLLNTGDFGARFAILNSELFLFLLFLKHEMQLSLKCIFQIQMEHNEIGTTL